MNVYILTLVAGRQDGTSIGVAAKTLLTIQPSYEAAHAEGIRVLNANYPHEEGWQGRSIDVVRLPQEIEDSGYRLVWQLTPISSTVFKGGE